MNDPSTESPSLWTWLALLASAVGVAGSLWLSLGMGLIACPLCFYQRAFVMGACGVLAIGALARVVPGPRASLLALAPVVGGLGVAGFHVYLEVTKTLECPTGIFGTGTAPQQSLTIFAILFILLSIDVAHGCRAGSGCNKCVAAGGLAAFVLGGLFSVGCIASGPPLPKAPDKPYPADKPINTCRPPYRST